MSGRWWTVVTINRVSQRVRPAVFEYTSIYPTGNRYTIGQRLEIERLGDGPIIMRWLRNFFGNAQQSQWGDSRPCQVVVRRTRCAGTKRLHRTRKWRPYYRMLYHVNRRLWHLMSEKCILMRLTEYNNSALGAIKSTGLIVLPKI